jgi:hypothetical protein
MGRPCYLVISAMGNRVTVVTVDCDFLMLLTTDKFLIQNYPVRDWKVLRKFLRAFSVL